MCVQINMTDASREMIRAYKAQCEPAKIYHKQCGSWLDTLGKIDMTLPILTTSLICMLILLMKKKG